MKKEFPDTTISSMKIANKILFIILILIILSTFWGCAGPSLAETERIKITPQDSLKPTPVSSTPTNKWKNNTYNASDFGLVPGVVVRWVPDELPKDITINTFPEVHIHIKQNDGVTKVFLCTFDMWQQLLTNDTLR